MYRCVVDGEARPEHELEPEEQRTLLEQIRTHVFSRFDAREWRFTKAAVTHTERPLRVSVRFVRSSFQKVSGGVRVRRRRRMIQVRDGKRLSRHTHNFFPEEWRAFLDGVKAGEFDISALEASTA
jgi:hypothetical protein